MLGTYLSENVMASERSSTRSSTYLSYSSAGDHIWPLTDLDDSFSSGKTTPNDDDGEEKYHKVFQIRDKVDFLLDVNRDESYDTLIEDVFSKITGKELVIYPPSESSDAAVSHLRKILICPGTFWEGAFVYTSKCLLVTLNVDTGTEKVKVPRCLYRDICIFTENYPPIVFSLVKDSVNLSKSEEYNKLVGRRMTFLLRKMSRISVISEVLDLTNDSKVRVEDVLKKSSHFAIKSSLVMDHDKFRNVVVSFIRCIGLSETFSCCNKDIPKGKDVFLTVDELMFLMDALDGMKENGIQHVTSWAPFLASEIAVRLAKTSATLLELTPAHHRVTDWKRLMKNNPSLDVKKGDTKECFEMTHFQHYVSECSDLKKVGQNRNVWKFETELPHEMGPKKSTQQEFSRFKFPNVSSIQRDSEPGDTIRQKELRMKVMTNRTPVSMFAPFSLATSIRQRTFKSNLRVTPKENDSAHSQKRSEGKE